MVALNQLINLLILEEEVDLINLGGACAAPLPKKTNPDNDDILSDFSMITGNQLHPHHKVTKTEEQRTSVDLLSDLDLSGAASSTQPLVEDEGLNRFSISQSSANQSSSPKLAYTHPSRQTGIYRIWLWKHIYILLSNS